MPSFRYTEDQIALVFQLKDKGLTWFEIAQKFNKKFATNCSPEHLRGVYKYYKHYYDYDENYVGILKKSYLARKRASELARTHRKVFEVLDKKESILEGIKDLVDKFNNLNFKKHYEFLLKRNDLKRNKKKKSVYPLTPMTVELLLSDIHYGKYVKNAKNSFLNIDIIKHRMKKLVNSVIKEIQRESQFFKIDRLIIALLGDIIENAEMHGKESLRSSEFSTARQVQEAIESLFLDVIVPLSSLNIPIHIPCVTGNHDRIASDKVFISPGEDNLTYIIYKTLELLSKQAKIKNITFDIVPGVFTHVDIYGHTIVYEHGDALNNFNRMTLINQMAKRQTQIKKVVSFYRIGHFHEPVIYAQGRMIVNGSVVGQDEYGEAKGFLTEPVQFLNFYVKTKNRDTPFYKSFPVYLKFKDEEKEIIKKIKK